MAASGDHPQRLLEVRSEPSMRIHLAPNTYCWVVPGDLLKTWKEGSLIQENPVLLTSEQRSLEAEWTSGEQHFPP